MNPRQTNITVYLPGYNIYALHQWFFSYACHEP